VLLGARLEMAFDGLRGDEDRLVPEEAAEGGRQNFHARLHLALDEDGVALCENAGVAKRLRHGSVVLALLELGEVHDAEIDDGRVPDGVAEVLGADVDRGDHLHAYLYDL